MGFRVLKSSMMFDGEENEQDGGESEEGEQMMDDGPAYTLELAEAAYKRIADRLALDNKGEMPQQPPLNTFARLRFYGQLTSNPCLCPYP